MKRTLTLILTVLMLCTLLFGCGQKSVDGDPQDTNTEPALADGVYTADFSTDSSMFHVNEACEGKGTLTVENGQMTIHISLPSKSILNLFCGTAEGARKDGAALLQPTTDTVAYSDGLSEEVNGFDIPVPALDEEFDVAIIGTAFGAGFYAGGIICYAFIFLAMQVLRRVDLRIRKTQRVSTVYFEMEKKSTVGQIIRQVKGHGHYIWDLNLFSETQEKSGGPVCGTFTLWVNGKTTLDEEIQALEALDGVSYITLM